MSCFSIPGDLALSEDGRRLLWWQGADEIASRVNVGIQVHTGTWFYDLSRGVRWSEILGEKMSTGVFALLRAEIWRKVQDTPGIGAVQSVVLTPSRTERAVRVAWRALSDAGVITGNVDWA